MALHYLTSDIPGTGGVIKERPEDFLVHELPLYEPSGKGEHLYLLVEKQNHTTMDIVYALAKLAGVKPSAIGYAGLKDKHAITRQLLSVHLPDVFQDAKLLERLETFPGRVLWADRHTNKLRRGHHAGNRFDIRIRQVQIADVLKARAVLRRLQEQGVPNYFGPQRFGFEQTNDQLGKFLLLGRWQDFLDLALSPNEHETNPEAKEARQHYLQGDYALALACLPHSFRQDRQMLTALQQGADAKSAVLSLNRQHRELLASAFQSAMFNQVLSRRIADGLFAQLIPGDLAWKHDSGAVFAVDEPTADLENNPQGRMAPLAISPSGPLWGKSMTRPSGQVLQWELDALTQQGLTEADLTNPPHPTATSLPGQRRPMRIVLSDPEVRAGGDDHGPYIQVAFKLERGGFATAVLNEIMKP